MNRWAGGHDDCRAHPEMRRACGCRMQAKDIADALVLAVIDAKKSSTGMWTLVWDFDAVMPNVPRKVLLAKMESLIRRGLVTGCTCGCRGDFERVDRTNCIERTAHLKCSEVEPIEMRVERARETLERALGVKWHPCSGTTCACPECLQRRVGCAT